MTAPHAVRCGSTAGDGAPDRAALPLGLHGRVTGDVANELSRSSPTRTSPSRRPRRSPATSCRVGASRAGARRWTSFRDRRGHAEPRRRGTIAVGQQRAEPSRRRTMSRRRASSPTPPLHRLQGVRGRVQAVEPAPRRRLRFTGMSYDNTGALGASTWRHVAFVERPVPLGGQDRRAAGLLVADDVGRLQALRARRVPGGLPDRRHRAHRVRLRLRPARRLQRLRLLRRRPARSASSTGARTTAAPGSARSATTG